MAVDVLETGLQSVGVPLVRLTVIALQLRMGEVYRLRGGVSVVDGVDEFPREIADAPAADFRFHVYRVSQELVFHMLALDKLVEGLCLGGQVEPGGAAAFAGPETAALRLFRRHPDPVFLLAAPQMPAALFVVNGSAGKNDHRSHLELLSVRIMFLV